VCRGIDKGSSLSDARVVRVEEVYRPLEETTDKSPRQSRPLEETIDKCKSQEERFTKSSASIDTVDQYDCTVQYYETV